MDNLAAVGEYFERKGALWTSSEGSVAAHLRRVGRNGLVAEFRSDPDFDVVSRYLHRMVDVQVTSPTRVFPTSKRRCRSRLLVRRVSGRELSAKSAWSFGPHF